MSAEALCKRVTEFGFKLLEHGFALDARQHTVARRSNSTKDLIWARDGAQALIISTPLRVADYLSLIERLEYSYLMHDGALVQIAYIIKNKKIEKHRLVFYPCPFEIVLADLQRHEGGVLDYIIDNFMSNVEANVVLKSPIRFDFAPEAAQDFHPASHITINDPSCRIPVRAPLSFDTFMKFILENFYVDACHNREIMAALRFAIEPDCLSPHDRGRAFLNWTKP
jgi:hypothetical protein